MVTRKDYTAEAVEASRSVLLELMCLLGAYKENIVLIGGWIPEFLVPRASEPYVGSMDVDLALNHSRIKEEAYRTIQQLMLSRGYEQGQQPFIFKRKVSVGNKVINVEVDLLAGEYAGTSKGRRHQKIQGIFARKARGCDLAFEMSQDVTIEGSLPEGGLTSATIRIASVVPFLVMKGMALDERLKEKDAWDIYWVVKSYPGGLDALVEEFKPHLGHGLVKEGLMKIAKHFASEKHIGPKFVADFDGIVDKDDRDLRQRDAHEKVNYVLQKLGIK